MLMLRNENRLVWVILNRLIKLSLEPYSLLLGVVNPLNVRGGNSDKMIAVYYLVIVGFLAHEL